MPWLDYMVYYNGALVTCKSKHVERHTALWPELSRRLTGFIRNQSPTSFIAYEVRDRWYASCPLPDSHRTVFGLGPTDSTPEVVDHTYAATLAPTKILAADYHGWATSSKNFGS